MYPALHEPDQDEDPQSQTHQDVLASEPSTADHVGEPPTDFTPPVVAPIEPRRSPWQIIAIVALALVLMATGVGIGLATAHRTANTGAVTASVGSVSTSAASVTLPATVADLQQTIITVTKSVQASVVEVTSTSSNGTAIGSGEFLTKDGYIVTNNHVVTGFTSYSVTLADGTVDKATLVGQDAQDDLAVLKIAITNATPIAIADSSQAVVGSFVLAIGNPLGLQESTSFGVISGLNRAEAEQSATNSNASGPVLTGLIQTTAALNPGNSGGALVNLGGQLVGIPTLGATTTSSGETVSGIGFAIPANRVVYVVNQLMQLGHLTATNQGFLGIQGQAATSSQSATGGVTVAGFSSATSGSSPAQSGGVQVGDTITAVNGTPITDSTDLAGAILIKAPGTRVTLTVVRGGSTQSITVTLGERPLSNA